MAGFKLQTLSFSVKDFNPVPKTTAEVGKIHTAAMLDAHSLGSVHRKCSRMRGQTPELEQNIQSMRSNMLQSVASKTGPCQNAVKRCIAYNLLRSNRHTLPVEVNLTIIEILIAWNPNSVGVLTRLSKVVKSRLGMRQPSR
jgi:hypothetical protein